ncbi:carboxypeptidase regulatory-like domain-containing protein [Micromonospora chersina]
MRKIGSTLTARAAGAAVVGFAVTVAVAWLVLLALAGTDGSAGMLARLLGADLSSLVVAAASSTGAPVRWSLPGLGVGGQLWPVNMLFTGSPLALLVLAPVAGALVTGMLAARFAVRHRQPLLPMVGAAAVGYGLVSAAAAELAALTQTGTLGRVSTSPWLVLLFATGWTALVGGAGAVLRDAAGTTTRTAARPLPRTRRTAAAAAATLLTTMAVAVGSTAPTATPTADPAGTREPAPVGHQRPGVAGALTQVKLTSGDRYNVTLDPWRGVPSVISLHSPLVGSVPGWLRRNAGLFAVTDPTSQLKQVRSERDQLGQQHIWYQQTIAGVPVHAARVGVHLDAAGAYVQALSNGMQPGLTPDATKPARQRSAALAVTARLLPGGRPIGNPELYLLPEQPRPGQPTRANLVWRVVWADPAGGASGVQAYFVAASGEERIVKSIPVSMPVKYRVAIDYANTADPVTYRLEGGPATGIGDLDKAYTYAGGFHDYYKSTFGRDSYDGSGAHLTSWTRWTDTPGEVYVNAYWDGEKTVFGDGMVTADIAGHEWTHAVVERTANLVYLDQSGALNESYADIFGELIERHQTGSMDWLMGTGSSIGTIRSFANPPDYDQPDHLRDYLNDCFDGGGVHTNSGIPNKAFYLLAQRIGLTKAAAVSYRALTTYLHDASGFTDARNGSIQAAWDLYGKSSQEAKEVWRAWGSVGVDGEAEPFIQTCTCFAEASLHGSGLELLDAAGMDASAVASALLRTRDLLASGASPALAHYSLVYSQANAAALRLLTADEKLQQRTAHAMQSLAPLLVAVGTPAGDDATATRELIDELNALFDAYIAADRADGDGQLAELLARERGLVDTSAMVGMTANQVKTYLDRVFAGTAPAGTVPRTSPGKVDADVQRALAGGGRTTVMVQLRDTADLSGAARITDRVGRLRHVRQQLGLTAEHSQRGLVGLLSARGASFERFWIANAVLVRGADRALIDALAARGEVRRIRKPGTVALPTPTAATKQALVAAIDGVEWGIDRIRADQTWSELNVRGTGVVVANIDTGVQYDHPALVNQYRGHRADGSFDHNYNWYDPSGACPDPAPCDGQGHGTHTMGTMVGDDGTNHIGVAPGATWIAARGCESSTCSEESLLNAGEWIIAPTDLNGGNPRPDLAPHVVNNSWGGGQGDTFFDDIVNAWVQAGIFPVFANGNEGPDCATAVSPGDAPATYGVGAFDENGAIATFSGRGASSVGGETKPNIAAPGVAIRSAAPEGEFTVLNGTSMATPHVAGTVALMWSAAPALVGDIAATRALLDDTAVDTVDLTCGGTADDNNVWGEGKLDAYSAVSFIPQGPTGSVIGVVSDSRGAPIAGARITAVDPDGAQKSTAADPSGAFSLAAPVGTYQVTVKAFGYRDATSTVTVTEGAASRADRTLFMQPRYPVSGQVTHAGAPVSDATVTLDGTGLPASATDAEGVFGFPRVPAGSYTLVTAAAQCAAAGSRPVTVDWDETLTVAATDRGADGPYACARIAHTFPATDTVLQLTGDDAATAVPLPFPFPYYGVAYRTAYVTTNGSLNFQGLTSVAINGRVPGPGGANAAIHPFWDDLVVDGAAQVRTGASGDTFVIEWRNVTFEGDPTQRVTFAVSLTADGLVRLHYGALTGGPLALGGSATVGVEDESGTVGLEYLRDRPLLTPHTTVEFTGTDGRVAGTVTSAAGGPVAGVTVTADEAWVATTDAAGRYLLPLPPGDHELTFSHPDHTGQTAQVTVATRQLVTLDMVLQVAPVDVSGLVTDPAGAPLAGVSVTLVTTEAGAPVATTDELGRYTLSGVPVGSATVRFSGLCRATRTETLTVDGAETFDLTLTGIQDTFGYTCGTVPVESFPTTTPVALVGDDVSVAVPVGFPVPFYGTAHSTVVIGSNGLLGFSSDPAPYKMALALNRPPDTGAPNNAFYVFSDDMKIDSMSRVTTAVIGTGPDRRFVIEWGNITFFGVGGRATVQAVLYEDGRLRVQYLALPDSADGRGRDAGVGIENATGTSGLAPSWRQELLRPGLAIEFRPPAVS